MTNMDRYMHAPNVGRETETVIFVLNAERCKLLVKIVTFPTLNSLVALSYCMISGGCKQSQELCK